MRSRTSVLATTGTSATVVVMRELERDRQSRFAGYDPDLFEKSPSGGYKEVYAVMCGGGDRHE